MKSVVDLFTISVNRECGGNLLGLEGEITSPNYPDNYYNLMECEWVITVEPLMLVRLEIQEFEIESSSNCMFDSLQVNNTVYVFTQKSTTLLGKSLIS